IATSSDLAAASRRLTGVARGGAFVIARHSLPRGASSAAADAMSWHSKARTAEKIRNMAGPVSGARPALYRAIPRRQSCGGNHLYERRLAPWSPLAPAAG